MALKPARCHPWAFNKIRGQQEEASASGGSHNTIHGAQANTHTPISHNTENSVCFRSKARTYHVTGVL